MELKTITSKMFDIVKDFDIHTFTDIAKAFTKVEFLNIYMNFASCFAIGLAIILGIFYLIFRNFTRRFIMEPFAASIIILLASVSISYVYVNWL